MRDHFSAFRDDGSTADAGARAARPSPKEATWGDRWLQEYEERAASREFGAGMTRADAERHAWTDTLAAWAREHAPDACPCCAAHALQQAEAALRLSGITPPKETTP